MRLPLMRALPLLLCLCASAAGAQVRHCRTPDGLDVYTDRPCAELGASVAPETPTPPATGATYHPDCARSLRDLVFALQTAIDRRDPNRLAESYLWTGLSTHGGYAVLDRLGVLAQRPLAGIAPVYGGGGDTLAPSQPAPRAPVALRLEQTLGDGATPANTVLALRRQIGCWWVSF